MQTGLERDITTRESIFELVMSSNTHYREILGKNDGISVRNFQSNILEMSERIGGNAMSKTVLISRLTSYNCPVGTPLEYIG